VYSSLNPAALPLAHSWVNNGSIKNTETPLMNNCEMSRSESTPDWMRQRRLLLIFDDGTSQNKLLKLSFKPKHGTNIFISGKPFFFFFIPTVDPRWSWDQLAIVRLEADLLMVRKPRWRSPTGTDESVIFTSIAVAPSASGKNSLMAEEDNQEDYGEHGAGNTIGRII